MRRFILQRLASIIVTLWLLATIVFLLVNVLPGNVGRQILGPFAPEVEVDAFNARLGTDKPLIEQYVTSIKRIFTLDFGDSYQSGTAVIDVILPALGRSGKLALLAFLITTPAFAVIVPSYVPTKCTQVEPLATREKGTDCSLMTLPDTGSTICKRAVPLTALSEVLKMRVESMPLSPSRRKRGMLGCTMTVLEATASASTT